MRKLVTSSFILVIFIWTLSTTAAAQQMFLESSNGFQSIETCDYVHHIDSCDVYHVTIDGSSAMSSGTTILLNGQEARVDWAGEGYKLTNGTIISKQAAGVWEQVWPSISPTKVSDWQDVDRNSYLTVSDQVTVNGASFAVEDHRYFIWVTPLQ